MVIRLLHHILQPLGDHLPGHPVDGRRAHRLVQAGLCHPAHPFSAVHPDPLRGRVQPDPHFHAVGHVKIVSRVLFHGAVGPTRLPAQVQHRGLHRDALGG